MRFASFTKRQEAILDAKRCRYQQAFPSLSSTLAVVGDPQPLRVDNLSKVDVANLAIGGQGKTVAEAGRADAGVDDARGLRGGVGGEGDGAEEADVVGRGGVRVGGLGKTVEGEDVDLAEARAGHGRAGGETGVELAAVAAGGDAVEANQYVVVRDAAVVGDRGDVDGHVVGRGRWGLLLDVVDEGGEDRGAGARHEVVGARWGGGGEDGAGQEGSGDGEGVHLGLIWRYVCLVLNGVWRDGESTFFEKIEWRSSCRRKSVSEGILCLTYTWIWPGPWRCD